MILCYVKRVTKSLCQKPWTTKVNMLLLRVLVVMNIRGENEIQCNMKKSEMTSLRYHSYFSVFNSVSQKGGDFANICNLHSLGDGARARATNGLIPETNDAPAWMEYIYLCSSQSNIPFYGKNSILLKETDFLACLKSKSIFLPERRRLFLISFTLR